MTNRPHPHFDDHGTLDWNTRWSDALARAQHGGKFVFIEMGRAACSNCRSLVEAVVPQAAVAELLRERFVPLASDIDDPEPEVLDLAMQNLKDAMMLPFVLITDSEGNFLHGGHGAVNPAQFLQTLQQVDAATE